jgi:ribosome recycling factor
MSKTELSEEKTPFEGQRQKFATQMDAELLRQLRAYAKSEGRQIQSVLEEAVAKLLKDRQGYQMRPDVHSAYQESLERYSDLYVALAK